MGSQNDIVVQQSKWIYGSSDTGMDLSEANKVFRAQDFRMYLQVYANLPEVSICRKKDSFRQILSPQWVHKTSL